MLCRWLVLLVSLQFALLTGHSAQAVSIVNSRLSLQADPGHGALSLTDLHQGLTWTQAIRPLPPPIQMPRCSQAPSLEGTLEGWTQEHPITLTGPGRTQAQILLQCDPQNLYLCATVTDPHPAAAPSDSTEPWNCDSLELWLGNSQAIIFLCSDAGQPVAVRAGVNYTSYQTEALHFFPSPEGYRIQGQLARENFTSLATPAPAGMQARPAAAVGMNFSSTPGQRDGQAYYPKGWHYGDIPSYGQWVQDAPSSGSLAQESQTAGLTITPTLTQISEHQLLLTTQLPGVWDAYHVLIPATVTYTLSTTDSLLTAVIECDPAAIFDEVIYPYAFAAQLDDPWMVFPNGPGMLLPLRRDHPDYFDYGWNTLEQVYHSQGINNACLGMVDLASGAGLQMIFDTPWLAGFRMLETASPKGDPLTVPGARFYSDLGHATSPYVLTFIVHSDGGYVAQAKAYRQAIWTKRGLRTLHEKAQLNPGVLKAAGAPVFWLMGAPDQVLEMAQTLKQDGMQRAIINIEAYYYERLGRTDWAEQLPGVITQIEAMGYLVSRYDQYRDTHPLAPERSIYTQWNTEAYEQATQDKRGDWIKGFGQDSRVIEPPHGLELVRRNIPATLAKYPYNAYFIDNIGYVPPIQDTSWRAGRTVTAAQAQQCKALTLAFLQAQGCVVGTEAANDWPLAWASWTEGGLTFQTMAWGAPGWGYQELPPTYETSLSVKYRIPFSALVAGDCATTSWRWDDGMDRYPQYWQRRNLWTVLDGGSPMYFLNFDAFMRLRRLIAHNERYVCRTVQRTAGQAMVAHRFLTPNRQVQEALWASGQGVVVNFGSQPHTLPSGDTVAPMDYLAFSIHGNQIEYQAPPAAAIDYDYRTKEFTVLHEDFELGYGQYVTFHGAPDRVQDNRVLIDPAQVIEGKASAQGENNNPGQNWMVFMSTDPYLVPLQPRTRYAVTFRYKALRAEPGKAMFCTARSGLAPQDFAGDIKWTPKDGEQGQQRLELTTGASPLTQIAWGMEGQGKILIDQITIQKLPKEK